MLPVFRATCVMPALSFAEQYCSRLRSPVVCFKASEGGVICKERRAAAGMQEQHGFAAGNDAARRQIKQAGHRLAGVNRIEEQTRSAGETNSLDHRDGGVAI